MERTNSSSRVGYSNVDAPPLSIFHVMGQSRPYCELPACVGHSIHRIDHQVGEYLPKFATETISLQMLWNIESERYLATLQFAFVQPNHIIDCFRNGNAGRSRSLTVKSERLLCEMGNAVEFLVRERQIFPTSIRLMPYLFSRDIGG